MANILASGTSLADSSTFTLAAGESKTVYMVSSDFPNPRCAADIQIQAADNSWTTISQLRGVVGETCKVVQAVGTFRVQRRVSPKAFGVDAN